MLTIDEIKKLLEASRDESVSMAARLVALTQLVEAAFVPRHQPKDSEVVNPAADEEAVKP